LRASFRRCNAHAAEGLPRSAASQSAIAFAYCFRVIQTRKR
jgi:hypothetical protein